MKKAASLALLCALTLCACAPGGVTTPTPESTPTPDPTATTLSGGILLPNGRLPDGSYTPPAAAPRYYSQPTYTLIPRDDYGRIWPYIGGYAAQWWMMGELYGLCDENGTILCDPVFNKVELIEQDGHRLYALTEYGRGTDGEQSDTTTLAALDGRWAEVVDGYQETDNIWEWHADQYFRWGGFLDYQYITAQKDGKWGVLDYDGTELLPFAYLEPVCFYEGLAAALSDDGASVYFIDITGTPILGPYDVPPRQIFESDFTPTAMPLTYSLFFVDGVCRFYDEESGLFGLIDREGQVVLPPQYDYITCFNGQMAQFLKGEYNGILNTDGVEIFSRLATNAWLTHVDGGVVIDHKELLSPDGTRVPYEPEDDPEPIPFPLPDDCSDYEALENGTFLLRLRRDGEDLRWQIYDQHGAPLSPARTGYASSWDHHIYTSDWDSSYESAVYHVFELNGNPLFSGEYFKLFPFDDRFLARAKNYAGLLDESGNWIIRVPIFDYNAD